MEFGSANPSVVRSVKQRDLLNAWLRACGRQRVLPKVADYRPERIADELADMMGFDVEGRGDTARFLITQEGARLTATYGNEHPDKRATRYLEEAIGPTRYARVAPSYLVCLARKRPSYSISLVQDADNIQGGFGLTEENEMLADWVFEVPLAHIGAAAGFNTASQGFDSIDQIVVVAIRLFQRPVFERVEPDIFQVSFG